MLQLQNAIRADDGENSWSQDEGSVGSGENCFKDERLQGTLGSIGISPYVFGDLQILSLGNFFSFEFLGIYQSSSFSLAFSFHFVDFFCSCKG